MAIQWAIQMKTMEQYVFIVLLGFLCFSVLNFVTNLKKWKRYRRQFGGGDEMFSTPLIDLDTFLSQRVKRWSRFLQDSIKQGTLLRLQWNSEVPSRQRRGCGILPHSRHHGELPDSIHRIWHRVQEKEATTEVGQCCQARLSLRGRALSGMLLGIGLCKMIRSRYLKCHATVCDYAAPCDRHATFLVDT